MNGLTPRQQQVLDFICQSTIENGYPPTLREIGSYFGIHSPNGVMCHLDALEKKGRIRRSRRASRGLTMIVASEGAEPCCAACGKPL